jgi:hypothetical protein
MLSSKPLPSQNKYGFFIARVRSEDRVGTWPKYPLARPLLIYAGDALFALHRAIAVIRHSHRPADRNSAG